GVYPLSMAIDLFGEPNDIDYFPVYLSNGIDGSGTLVLSYPEHVGTIMCSKVAQGTIPSEIHGEDGILTLDHIAPITKLTFTNRKNNRIVELSGQQLKLDIVYELKECKLMIYQNNQSNFKKWME